MVVTGRGIKRNISSIVRRRILADVNCHLLEGFQFALAHQVKLADKIVEMLVASIDVGFSTDGHKSIKVMDINVDKHPEQSRQYLLALTVKCLGKRNI